MICVLTITNYIVLAFDNRVRPQLTEGAATGQADGCDDRSVAEIRAAKGRRSSACAQEERCAHPQDESWTVQDFTETLPCVGSPFNVVENVAMNSKCRSTCSMKPKMEEIVLLGVSAESSAGRSARAPWTWVDHREERRNALTEGKEETRTHATLLMSRIFLAVMTTAEERFRPRIDGTVSTYLRFFTEPVLVLASGREADGDEYLHSLRDRLGGHVAVNSDCHGANRKAKCQLQTALRLMHNESSRRDWFCATENKNYLNARNLLAALDHYNPDKNFTYLSVCSRDQHPCEFFCLSRGALASFSPKIIAEAGDPYGPPADRWLSKMLTSLQIYRRTSACALSEYSWFVDGGMVRSVAPRLFRGIIDKAVVFPVDWLGQLDEIRDYHDYRNADCTNWPATSVLDDSYPCRINTVNETLGVCSLQWLQDVCEMDQPSNLYALPFRDCVGYGLGDVPFPGTYDTDRHHPAYLELTQNGFCDFLQQNKVGGVNWAHNRSNFPTRTAEAEMDLCASTFQ